MDGPQWALETEKRGGESSVELKNRRDFPPGERREGTATNRPPPGNGMKGAGETCLKLTAAGAVDSPP